MRETKAQGVGLTQMQYETRAIGNEEILALPGEPGPRARRGLIIGIVVTVLVVALIGYLLFGHAKPEASKPTEQLPLVSVVVPGRSTVARTRPTPSAANG